MKKLIRALLRFVRSFMIISLSLLLVTGIVMFALYSYFNSLFDFDWSDGEVKFFGQVIDVDDANMSFTQGRFSRKYVRRQSSCRPDSRFEVNLHETQTTVSFHEESSYLVECEVEQDRELSLSSRQDAFFIEVEGGQQLRPDPPRTC